MADHVNEVPREQGLDAAPMAVVIGLAGLLRAMQVAVGDSTD